MTKKQQSSNQMAQLEVKPPANFYSVEDYIQNYPDLSEYPGKISFPEPFTFGDYKRWYRAFYEEVPGSDAETSYLQEYRAAYEVVEHWELEGLPKKAASLDNDDLPMVVAAFVTKAAEEYIGPKAILETANELVLRRARDGYTGVEFDTADMTKLLPDLVTYPGKLTFPENLTAGLYRAWGQAMVVKREFNTSDIENSMIARQYRGALTLISDWNVEGMKRSELTESGDNVPLVLVSWLIDCADAYLSCRLSQKALRVR